VQVDPDSENIIGTLLLLPGVGEGVDVGEGSVWVAVNRVKRPGSTMRRALVLRVDPDSHRILTRVEVERGSSALDVGEGAVWVTSGAGDTVSRVDPRTERVVAQVTIKNRTDLVVAGAGAVWVRTFAKKTLARIDPATNQISSRSELTLLNVGPEALWVVGDWAPNGGLRPVDPRTFQPLGPVLGLDIAPVFVGVAGRDVWVGKNFYYCELHNPIPEGPPIVSFAWFKVDPVTLRPLSSPIFVGGNAGTPVFGEWSFWMAPEYGTQLIKIHLASAARIQATPTPGLPSPFLPLPP
jgi:hypothetical protein